ncbi:unnamed protein product [Adineta steineri]|uniref:F-box domain-containing protein n=1 Tax=Adineta steineri TaxID=433720 RepID=A0A819DB64_9BILA|nr:unnamed protein product [Adineta steineri]CAF3832769.1 unnamed protein product [Adineta steineri]
MSSFLNKLPCEIYHIIFDYFWAHEILHSFLNINDYIDSILFNYQNYKINGQSIRKSHFDLICQKIQPNQVTSLILSNDNHTPNQSELFRSRFSIEQFTRLRAFKSIEIDDEGASYFVDLYKLKHLISLEIILRDKLPFIKPSPSLQRLIIKEHSKSYFNYNVDPIITTIHFEHIGHLTLSTCSCKKLQEIFRRAIHLISLNVTFTFADKKQMARLINFHQKQSKIIPLKYLSLTIGEDVIPITIARAHLEGFLTPFTCLQKFELFIYCHMKPECYDADRWKIFIVNNLSRLTTFNFKFSDVNIDENVLDKYRQPFWMEKCWFVATNENYSSLYTVPYFFRTSTKYSSNSISSKYTTLSIKQHITCYDRVIELEFDSDHRQALHRYNNIEKISLSSLNIDKDVIGLSKVKSLVIKEESQWTFGKTLLFIKEEIPSVDDLCLSGPHPNLDGENIPDISLEQINILTLPAYEEPYDDDCFPWSQYFPCVERLIANVNSKTQIPVLIDEFRSMVSGVFYVDSRFIDRKNPIEITSEWLIKNTHRLRNRNLNDFVCKINDRLSRFSICVWLADDKDHKL